MPQFYGTFGVPEDVLLPEDHPNGQTPCMRALRQVLAERDAALARAEQLREALMLCLDQNYHDPKRCDLYQDIGPCTCYYDRAAAALAAATQDERGEMK